MTGVAKHTVLKLLRDIGCACAAYHNSHVRNLRVRRVQADEIWSFVYGKDKNLTLEHVQSGLGSIWNNRVVEVQVFGNKRPCRLTVDCEPAQQLQNQAVHV